MGFTVTPLAQKARTKTLIADSDLNLGNYDLIATDVRGDTAEFSEFVGGVGNFSNVLGSGNLDIEGTGNIKGLTTFQNAVQVNGSLHVEGSINNVNIADNGEITTAQGVNGADFNGAKITSTKFNGATIDASGNITGVKGTFSGAVTGSTVNGATITSTKFNGATIDGSGNVTGAKFIRTANYSVTSSVPSVSNSYELSDAYTCILPVREKPYNGTVALRKYNAAYGVTISYVTSLSSASATSIAFSSTASETKNITLSNAQCLYIKNLGGVAVGNITLT